MGYAKANAIFVALGKVDNGPVTMEDSTTYTIHSIMCTGNVISVGKESPSSKRSLFTVNAMLTIYQD